MTKSFEKKLQRLLNKGFANNEGTRNRAKSKVAERARVAQLVKQQLMAKGKPITKKNTQKKKKKFKKGRKGQRNDYFLSLQDPEKFAGVRIPDMNSYPTCVSQITNDLTMGTNVNGSAAFFISPVSADIWQPPAGQNFFVVGTAPLNTVSPAGAVSLYGIAAKVRVVSYIIKIEFVGASSTDQGQICGAEVIDILSMGTNLGNLSSFTQFQALPWSKTVPLRDGLFIRYRPADPKSFEFVPVTNLASGTWATYISTNDDVGPLNLPGIAVAVNGALVSSPCLRIRQWANYEWVPVSDQISSETSVQSPVNMSQLEHAMNNFSWTDIVNPLLALSSSLMGTMLQQSSQSNFGGQRGFARYINPGRIS